MMFTQARVKQCEQCGSEIRRFDLDHCRRLRYTYFCSQHCRTLYVRAMMERMGVKTMAEFIYTKSWEK